MPQEHPRSQKDRQTPTSVDGSKGQSDRGEEDRKKPNLQPGVEALGYVNRTTPDLLASTSALRVVFVLSLVSISPPNPSRSTVWPTVGGTLPEGDPA